MGGRSYGGCPDRYLGTHFHQRRKRRRPSAKASELGGCRSGAQSCARFFAGTIQGFSGVMLPVLVTVDDCNVFAGQIAMTLETVDEEQGEEAPVRVSQAKKTAEVAVPVSQRSKKKKDTPPAHVRALYEPFLP